jgi:hypothetical protein
MSSRNYMSIVAHWQQNRSDYRFNMKVPAFERKLWRCDSSIGLNPKPVAKSFMHFSKHWTFGSDLFIAVAGSTAQI